MQSFHDIPLECKYGALEEGLGADSRSEETVVGKLEESLKKDTDELDKVNGAGCNKIRICFCTILSSLSSMVKEIGKTCN